MLFIAFLNAVKSHFEKKRLRNQFKYHNDHSLKDIGFYRDHGEIFPLAGKQIKNTENEDDLVKSPTPQRSDG